MQGKLRPMAENDLDLVLEWRNAEDVRRNMYTHHVISPEEHSRWWQRVSIDPFSRLLIFEIDARPAGVVTFSRYTGKNGSATWAFYSGDRSRRGIGSQMERAALEYAFETLEVRRLECEVLDFNRPVVDFHLKHGFTLEGTRRDAYMRDGEHHDIYCLSMLSTEWPRSKAIIDNPPTGLAKLTGKTHVSTIDITPNLVQEFSSATGDSNPVHLQREAAEAAGFPGPIAHGMLVGSLFSRIFATEFPGHGTVYLSQNLRFQSPIMVGASAQIQFRVISQFGRKVFVETRALVNGKECVAGVAELLIPKHSAVS